MWLNAHHRCPDVILARSPVNAGFRDSFDVDAALEEVDDGATVGSKRAEGPQKPVHAGVLLKEIHQCELDLECVLTQLDQVRGEAEVKAKRKKLVAELNRHLDAVDKLRAAVNRCIPN